MRDFPNTRTALVEYEASQAERDQAWDTVENTEDVLAAEKADQEALRLVQDAYYRDTADINSRENCRRIHILDIYRVIDGSNTPKGDQHG